MKDSLNRFIENWNWLEEMLLKNGYPYLNNIVKTFIEQATVQTEKGDSELESWLSFTASDIEQLKFDPFYSSAQFLAHIYEEKIKDMTYFLQYCFPKEKK